MRLKQPLFIHAFLSAGAIGTVYYAEIFVPVTGYLDSFDLSLDGVVNAGTVGRHMAWASLLLGGIDPHIGAGQPIQNNVIGSVILSAHRIAVGDPLSGTFSQMHWPHVMIPLEAGQIIRLACNNTSGWSTAYADANLCII